MGEPPRLALGQNNTAAMDLTAPRNMHVDNEWRRWLAENIIIGADPNELVLVMVSSGIRADEAQL